MSNDLISRSALMQSLRGNVLVDVTPYLEDAIEEQPEVKERIFIQDAKMAADIKQAIEYFEDELSQIKVFAGIVSFQEKERKSIETALKVLRNALEERPEGQQDRSCATSHG